MPPRLTITGGHLPHASAFCAAFRGMPRGIQHEPPGNGGGRAVGQMVTDDDNRYELL
jgi:hypothetical protein